MLKPILISFFLTLLLQDGLLSQPILEADIEAITEMAEERLLNHDYYQALKYYLRMYDLRSDKRTAGQIAKLQMRLRDYSAAVQWYQKAMDPRVDLTDQEMMYHYGVALKMNNQYDDAQLAFRFFENSNSDPVLTRRAARQIEGIQLAGNLLIDPDIRLDLLPKTINSKFSEASPFFVGDRRFVFGAFGSEWIEDFSRVPKELVMKLYRATMVGDELSPNISAFNPLPIENGWHNNAYSITPDKKYRTISFARLHGNQISAVRIYVQEKLSSGWSEPYLLENPVEHTLMRHVQICYFDDRPCLFYVMQDPDDVSALDLYYSFYQGVGKMTYPVRLSNIVNTSQNEITPYYYKNQLYFSSDGHAGLGGYDIFVSDWDGIQWSAPYNIGLTYNSSADDFGYTCNSDQSKALFVSNRPGGPSFRSPTCCDNLYMINYLPDDTDRAASVDPPLSTKDTSPIPKEMRSEEDTAQVPVNEIGVRLNEPVLLPNAQFDKKTLALSNNATTDLDLLYNVLVEYPAWHIELSVHTDARGEKQENLNASQRIAEKMKNYIVRKGIGSERILAKGYGEAFILNQCKDGVLCSDEDHEYNRRTEFKWLGNLSDNEQMQKPKADSKPKIVFDQKVYDLGEITKGDVKTAVIPFKNMGSSDLVIELVTACTCTEIDWPSEPIKPGDSGVLSIRYDSKDKEGLQEVTVDILANTEPIMTETFFKILVNPK